MKRLMSATVYSFGVAFATACIAKLPCARRQ